MPAGADDVAADAPQPQPLIRSEDQFRDVALSGDSLGAAFLRTARNDHPALVDRYLTWLFHEAMAASEDGLTDEEIAARTRLRGSLLTNLLLLRADQETVTRVLAARVRIERALIASDPKLCLGTMDARPVADPAAEEMLLASSSIFLGDLLTFEGAPQRPLMPDTRYSMISKALLAQLQARFPEELPVYVGQVELTEDRFADYCKVEQAFLDAVWALPTDLLALREDYYRTLISSMINL